MNSRYLLTSKLCTLTLSLFVIFAFFTCKGDDEVMEPETMEPETINPGTNPEDTFEITSLTGSSQKGPYLIGSTITIFELENDLSPTGKSFAEEISDNLGSFELNNLSLASSFVELRASGFYYNEVTGNNSEAQLNLSALVDLAEKDAININILTTLEKKRVEYLIENGSTFVEAKKQALSEVLTVFEIDNANIPEAALLNIAQSGEGNAILLAISAIIQGNNTVGEVSEIISKISNDIEEDGVLDDQTVCIQLSTAGSFVNPQIIRQNLEEWYASAGTTVSIPDFETYLIQFVQNTPCTVESNITYPVDGFSGLNLLATENTVFQVGESYSMRAVLEEGTSLVVRVVGNNWSMNIGQGDTGWIVGDWDAEAIDLDRARGYTSARTGSIDFKINLTSPYPDGLFTDEIKFEMFENGSNVPTRTKVINIQGITPRPSAPYGLFLSPQSTTGPTENLLGRMFSLGNSQVNEVKSDNSYGIAAFLPKNFELEIFVQGQNFEFPIGGVNQGWNIEQIDIQENIWKLSASEAGYYEAEIDILYNQGCVAVSLETFINGERFNSFTVSDNNSGFSGLLDPPSGVHGSNILSEFNTIEAGDVSLATEIYDDTNKKYVLTGEGWSIPTPIMNEGWEYEEYDPITKSQTFYANYTPGSYYFDLKMIIEPYDSANPPEILVETFSGCAFILSNSFNVQFE